MAGSSAEATNNAWMVELTIDSGENLIRPRGWSQKLSLGRQMRTHARVWLRPGTKVYDKTCRIDKHGGSNPNWNDKVSFVMTEEELSKSFKITIDIYSTAVGLMLKDWLIGRYEFDAKDIPIGGPHSFSKQEVKRYGVVQGLINFKTNRIPFTPSPEPEPKVARPQRPNVATRPQPRTAVNPIKRLSPDLGLLVEVALLTAIGAAFVSC